MKKILLPVSFSEASKQALSHAFSIAKRSGATLSLLHCYPAQRYNREYDFGKEDYDQGIRRMMANFYNQCTGVDSDRTYNLITYPGPVSDMISQISAQYDLLVMSRKTGSQPKPTKSFSEKTFYLSSKSRCPVLITSANREEVSFQQFRNIWHLKRNETEEELVRVELGKFGVDPNLVVTKSLSQKKIVSAFWKNLVAYTQSHDKSLLKVISQSFEEEHIDLLILVNYLKGNFEMFVKDDTFQIISQFDLPILILQRLKVTV